MILSVTVLKACEKNEEASKNIRLQKQIKCEAVVEQDFSRTLALVFLGLLCLTSPTLF